MMLNKLECYVLGHTMDGWEPIHVIFKDTRRDFTELTFEELAGVVAMLLDMGYLDCYEEDRRYPISKLTKQEIIDHYDGGFSADELKYYPNNTVYYFRASKKGTEEIEKDIYKVYYSENS